MEASISGFYGLVKYIFDEVSIATLVLGCALALGVYVAHKSQGRPDFDWADMLRDEFTGKPAPFRLGIFISMAISSWFMVYVTLDRRYSEEMVMNSMYLYLIVWSGAKIVEKLIEIWQGKRFGLGAQNGANASCSIVTTSATSTEVVKSETTGGYQPEPGPDGEVVPQDPPKKP